MRHGDHANGYVILDEIGEGGMSIVYLAHDTEHRNKVVVKQLKQQLATDAEFVARFRQAATIMQALRHPNLASVIDYIEQDGLCLVVEEYLAGGSLADLIDRGERISEEQALAWCRDVLRGVDHAHQNGVVHRDLKPGNLMLDGRGTIKVTDFGIAKAFGGPRLTRTRAEMGTPAYMSPEQIRNPQKAYHLTDVYSMGVVLYELLTHKIPFERNSDFDTKQAVVKDPPPPPRYLNPNISVELESIVLKALRKDPSQRYGGCSEFASRIDSYLKGVPPVTPGVTEWVKAHPWKAVLLLLVVVFALVVGLLQNRAF
jgi:serine/threonine protein kinase